MIRLSKLADYGIVLTTHLAASAPGKIHAAKDLARATAIPLPTVSKVMKALAHASIVTSHRGADGGFTLARPATDITVADLIAALDGPIAMTDCLSDDHDACGIVSSCGVRGHWDRISRAIHDALDGLTVAEMAKPSFPWEKAANRQVVS